MTQYSISERTPDHFLLKFDDTPQEIGPGTYNIKVRSQKKVVKPRPDLNISPQFSLTNAERALTKKPGFDSITAARPDDIRKWDTGFINHNPSPT